jgi:hypothetical protein
VYHPQPQFALVAQFPKLGHHLFSPRLWVGAYRPGDVLDLNLAEFLAVWIKRIADLIADVAANAVCPDSAKPSRLAAILTPAPKISLSSKLISPMFIPMRQ